MAVVRGIGPPEDELECGGDDAERSDKYQECLSAVIEACGIHHASDYFNRLDRDPLEIARLLEQGQ